MKEVSEDKEDDGEGSDISGYHSDSESAVMTSGNSPFISKEARYSFLSRSGKFPFMAIRNNKALTRSNSLIK